MTNIKEASAAGSPRLIDYLRLFRFANVFTAIAGVTMGFLFGKSQLAPIGAYVCLVGASILLYMAGMTLNDVYDIEQDRRERPDRPLASGRIALNWAKWLGYEMLIGGVILGFLGGFLLPDELPFWRPGLMALLLAGCILLYDAVLKSTAVGPVMMGGCRFFNVLMGMSATWYLPQFASTLGFGPHHLLVAGGIGLYILGVTWFARTEAHTSSRLSLASGLAVQVLGLVLLAMFPINIPADLPQEAVFPTHLSTDYAWPLLVGLIGFTIVRRCGMAISDPQPAQVQLAVKHGILSLIVIDAAVILMAGSVIWAIAVVVLLAPTLLFGYWIYST